MYFGERRASRTNLLWSHWILLMILPEVVIVKRGPYSKTGWMRCLWIWIMVDGLGPQYLLTSNFNRWYLVLQWFRVSLIQCFEKWGFTKKYFPEISLEDSLLVYSHTLLGWVLFFWQVSTWWIWSPWFFKIQFYSPLGIESLVAKVLLQKVCLSWMPIVQYYQRTGIVSFVCGVLLRGHWRKSERVMDWEQDPVVPCLGVNLVSHETIYGNLNHSANWKACQRANLSFWYFIPESIVPNIVKSFFNVKKSSCCMFSPIEAFHDGLG